MAVWRLAGRARAAPADRSPQLQQATHPDVDDLPEALEDVLKVVLVRSRVHVAAENVGWPTKTTM